MRLILLSQILFSSEQKVQLAFTNLKKKKKKSRGTSKSLLPQNQGREHRSYILEIYIFQMELAQNINNIEGTESGTLYANLMSNIVYSYLYFSPMPPAVLSWGENLLSMLQYQNITLSSTVRS